MSKLIATIVIILCICLVVDISNINISPTFKPAYSNSIRLVALFNTMEEEQVRRDRIITLGGIRSATLEDVAVVKKLADTISESKIEAWEDIITGSLEGSEFSPVVLVYEVQGEVLGQDSRLYHQRSQ